MVPSYRIGQVYNRREDIHAVLGGQQQGGIATPASSPVIVLFTGEAGEQHGYADGWDGSGVFHYTGEGQIGPMEFLRGNRAIRDHASDGKDLLLFEATAKRGMYRFLGRFDCANWEIRDRPDRDGNTRPAIVFHLISVDPNIDVLPPAVQQTGSRPLEELRKAAYAAAVAGEGKAGTRATRSYYARSAAVADYVLARARGKCECCAVDAPFLRKDGRPYLEPHHIRRVSDGGPDHPRWVGALCPTCHRAIHYGVDGEKANETVRTRVAELEKH